MWFITSFNEAAIQSMRRQSAANEGIVLPAPEGEAYSRVYGYFTTLEDAKRALDTGDYLREGLYSYCLIEQIPEGIDPVPDGPIGSNEVWHVWESNASGGKWVELNGDGSRPSGIEGIFGCFALS